MPMIATTIISSIRVKPRWIDFMDSSRKRRSSLYSKRCAKSSGSHEL
jgi:hypothetical protein